MSDTETITKIDVRTEIQEPPRFAVIYHNDDKTTYDFVIESLMNIFDYTEEDAEDKAQEVHTEGAAKVAVYPYEIAEQKAMETINLARSQHYPLKVTIEAE